MRWEKKGHEFEGYRKIFENKKVLIYGAGEKGQMLLGVLKPFQCVAGFIDRDKGKEKTVNMPVYSFGELEFLPREKYIIIIAATDSNEQLFARQLLVKGYREGTDFFFYQSFLNFYIGIMTLYMCNMVYAPFISFQVTNVCNLKCNGCAGFTPWLKHPKFGNIIEVETLVDRMFELIDVISILDVCGGEPFLMGEFSKIIKYIGTYRDKIITLRTVTNGTVIPSDELCEVLKEQNVKVIVDDYRESVIACRETFPKVKQKLEDYEICHEVRKANFWCDLGVSGVIKRSLENEAVNFFDECSNQIKSIHEGRFYSCDYAHYAADANAYDVKETDFLNVWEDYDKSVLTEFLIGYTETGYCNMCKLCNGHVTINQNHIQVARQLGEGTHKD